MTLFPKQAPSCSLLIRHLRIIQCAWDICRKTFNIASIGKRTLLNKIIQDSNAEHTRAEFLSGKRRGCAAFLRQTKHDSTLLRQVLVAARWDHLIDQCSAESDTLASVVSLDGITDSSESDP